MANRTFEELEELGLINLDTYLDCYDNYTEEFYQKMYEICRTDIIDDEDGQCWWHGAEDAPDYCGHGEPMGYVEDWEAIADYVAKHFPELGNVDC